MRAAEPLDAYLLPVEGLRIDRPWSVGPVTFLPPDAATRRIDDFASASPTLAASAMVAGAREALTRWTAAEVVATDLDRAIDLVRDAVAVLRLFHDRRKVVRGTPEFGLPGEVRVAPFKYVSGRDERIGAGFANRGPGMGRVLSADDLIAWHDAPDLQFVAGAIGREDLTEGERRALLGTRLLSRALLERSPDVRVLLSVIAVESMVLVRTREAQSFRLARRLAFLACGRSDGALCGRDRPTCPYLALDPARKADLNRLMSLRDRATDDVRWRCSEWFDILLWYRVRSDVVHAGKEVVEEEAHRIGFWIVRYLVPPVLEWLSGHLDDPIGELEAAIAALPAPPDWEKIIASGEYGD